MSYDWYIKSEHINLPNEIIALLKKNFELQKNLFSNIPAFNFL